DLHAGQGFLVHTAWHLAEPYFAADEATSFWKRGSLRSESNIGSSRSNAGVSGGFAARGASYGIESSFSRVEMERSRSCGIRAATRARTSSGRGPVSASCRSASRRSRAQPEPVRRRCHQDPYL